MIKFAKFAKYGATKFWAHSPTVAHIKNTLLQGNKVLFLIFNTKIEIVRELVITRKPPFSWPCPTIIFTLHLVGTCAA